MAVISIWGFMAIVIVLCAIFGAVYGLVTGFRKGYREARQDRLLDHTDN